MILVGGLAVGIWFVMRYAERLPHPSTSLVYDMKEANEAHFAAATDERGEVVLTSNHKVVLALSGTAFAVMVYGVIPWEDLGIGFPTLVVVPRDDRCSCCSPSSSARRQGEGELTRPSSTAPAISSGWRSSSASPASPWS